MTVEEFLKTNKSINLSAVANLMYPGTAAAPSRLLTKLSDKSTRKFNKEDERKAILALHAIGASFKEIDGY